MSPVGSESLGDELGVHVLPNFLDVPLVEPNDPAVVVVVVAPVWELVASRVLHHHDVAVSVDAPNLDAGRRTERLGVSPNSLSTTSCLPSNALDH